MRSSVLYYFHQIIGIVSSIEEFQRELDQKLKNSAHKPPEKFEVRTRCRVLARAFFGEERFVEIKTSCPPDDKGRLVSIDGNFLAFKESSQFVILTNDGNYHVCELEYNEYDKIYAFVTDDIEFLFEEPRKAWFITYESSRIG